MKKIIFTLFIIHCTLIIANAQTGWFWQNPVPQGHDLNSVKFINENTGWVVGEYGTIMKSTNKGINWTKQISTTTNNLYSIYIIDELKSLIVGDNGTILSTTNGGINWNAYPNIFNSNLRSVYFVNALVGFVACEN